MLTIYSLTNGRSTHEYSVRSLDADYILIKNKDFTVALTECIDTCKTKFFLVLDDDMFLHPKALKYITDVITKATKSAGVFFWYLWEDYTQTIRQSVHVYRTEAIKSIGGFTFDSYSKTCVATLKALTDSNWNIHEDKSVIAIHARGTLEETIKYNDLWLKRSKTYQKQSYKESLKYSKSVEYQYSLRDTFLTDLNIRGRNTFCEMSS